MNGLAAPSSNGIRSISYSGSSSSSVTGKGCSVTEGRYGPSIVGRRYLTWKTSMVLLRTPSNRGLRSVDTHSYFGPISGSALFYSVTITPTTTTMLVPYPYRYPMFDALRQSYRRPKRQYSVGLPVLSTSCPHHGTGIGGMVWFYSSIYPKVNVSLRDIAAATLRWPFCGANKGAFGLVFV